ncbi:DNA-directed RNA polymerase subunit E'' [Candidatus Woesearchaeota archaeon]|nr:DNA-directed RNA polymerase subunit E'' [Candidatus Woesearchaeota archaeon]
MKKVVCKSCKMFFEEGGSCPGCKKNSFTTSWQGRIHFINSKESQIAQKMGVETDGEYAIKIR